MKDRIVVRDGLGMGKSIKKVTLLELRVKELEKKTETLEKAVQYLEGVIMQMGGIKLGKN